MPYFTPIQRNGMVGKSLSDLKTRVVMIEGNPVEQEYLSALVGGAPGVTLIGAYNAIDGALTELITETPDLVLIDLDGLEDFDAEWLRDLHRKLPHTSVLILSSEKSREQVFKTLEVGVSGWLQKPCSADQIVRAILVVREGGAVLGNQIARHILEYFQARGSSVESLTAREREILGHLGRGAVSAEISTMLGITRDTMRTHVRNILIKLKANSRTEAVAKYLNPPV